VALATEDRKGAVVETAAHQQSGRVIATARRITVGRTDTALGAFYRRLSARVGKAKAVTATVRKIAVLFYNTLRHGMSYADPGAAYYEDRYRQRVLSIFNGERSRWIHPATSRERDRPGGCFLGKLRRFWGSRP